MHVKCGYVCMYVCIMKKQIEQTLLIFERKVLCKIFVPSKLASGYWIIKTNENVYKLKKKN